MTDGENTIGSKEYLSLTYRELDKPIPVYSIMFGDAVEYELRDIAKLTNARVFNGKENLLGAFKEVRGYN